MKNIPITVAFAVITTSQFVLGVWMMILAALRGGKVLRLDQRTILTQRGLSAPPRLRLHSRNDSADTV